MPKLSFTPTTNFSSNSTESFMTGVNSIGSLITPQVKYRKPNLFRFLRNNWEVVGNNLKKAMESYEKSSDN